MEMSHKLSDVESLLHKKSFLGFDAAMERSLESTFAYLFPCYYASPDGVPVTEDRLLLRFTETLSFVTDDREKASKAAEEVVSRLPEIYRLLLTDIEAAYEGDPAAANLDVIVLCYPAFKAICTYRVAHELYLMHLPVVPRAMTECAHRITGIDIHPGATIGESFFIDHGTGVVIGETTVIGDHVKLYQHVTLGAKSFAVHDDGVLVKGIKRHPNIGSNVVIYAGATILGGDTYIGDNCVIGGNVWLTHSVKAGETVTNRE